MSECKEYKLKELMQIKYGKDHKHLADGIYPLYGSGGIMRFVEKPLYEEESILIPRKGTLSNLFYLDKPFWSVDTMFYSKINKELTFPKYLYYTLKTFDLASLNVGSAVPSLTTEVLNEVLVSIPTLSTQKSISEILSSLDDKIELNNKINQELETLAQILFKQWFVDFEFPNENGEPYKSSGGEMVDTELGEIPKGWKVETIGKLDLYISDLVANGSFASIKENVVTTENEDYALFIRNTDLKNRLKNQRFYVNKHSYDFLKKTALFGGEIILPNVGDVGSVHRCPNFKIPMTLGNNCIMLKSNNMQNWLYTYFRSNIGFNSLRSVVIGSVQDKLSKTNFKSIRIVLPTVELLTQMEDFFSSIYNLQESNLIESDEYENLRDTLLPKLISGELQINDN
jgi:type I restriction enzyme S subunit